ncbi:hypothetical protein JAAARDRAFT_35342 [Jaapia argillacea MUCL 33604]|uniref:Uncharacterized protein n=1 Tax=Jaapia argillacea MUCL 33604 TaxID=933084 RepID=A0A067PS60_9AGAM|nr:hypothetical protein JAAARDRAFT_35342 [Jaapia argillacea MUCL 33604]
MMHALKTPPFFRPTSRPSSPAPSSSPHPDSTIGLSDRGARPRNKLSLATFKRTPSLTPAPCPTATLVQDGSYLEALSLKLSEAVSRALVHPTTPAVPGDFLGGRRPIPAGRGRALGELIASEIKAAKDNAHLRRAIFRCLQRPLSVLLTNLSSDLLPILSSPAFLNPPAPSVAFPNPNATQSHAIGLATLAGELLETFDEIGLGLDGDIRGDGLKSVREGLASVVNRVVNPLVAAIKNEIMPLIAALETPPPVAPVKVGLKVSGPHPSISALSVLMPIYARALARYTASPTSQPSLAPLLISLTWRGLVALAHRVPSQSVGSPQPAPAVLPASATKKPRATSTTPPTTPPPTRFTLKLPPSRPPSPPTPVVSSSAAADAKALFDLLALLPKPSAEATVTKVAREAVDEAFDASNALVALLEATQGHKLGKSGGTFDLAQELVNITAELPTLIALPILLRTYVHVQNESNGERTVASMLGLSDDDYKKGCLSGFGRAEECTPAVGQRVLEVLRTEYPTYLTDDIEVQAVIEWLEHDILEG